MIFPNAYSKQRQKLSGKAFPWGSILSTLMPMQYCYFSEYRNLRLNLSKTNYKSPKPVTSAPHHTVLTPSFLLLKPKSLEPFLSNLSSFVHSTHPKAHSLTFKIPTLNIRYPGQNPTSPVVCISVMRFIIQPSFLSFCLGFPHGLISLSSRVSLRR